MNLVCLNGKNKKMKTIKHIAIKTSVIIAVLALCSAGEKTEQTYVISQNIESSKNFDVLPSHTNVAFKEGEVLTYRMHYGIVKAGVAILEVKPDILDINIRKVYHIVCNGYTTGSTDWFYKVRDRYETYMDKDALLPWMFVRNVNEGGYKFNQNYAFNHYTKKVDVGGGEKFDVPIGVQDMVSAFYSARVFKKEEDLNVWVTDDKNHIIMRAQANVIIGSVKMDITSVKNLANESSKVE